VDFLTLPVSATIADAVSELLSI